MRTLEKGGKVRVVHGLKMVEIMGVSVTRSTFVFHPDRLHQVDRARGSGVLVTVRVSHPRT